MRTVALVVCAAWAAANAGAGSLFVAPAGSGTVCTQVSPCSLATAVGQAGEGDSVTVAAGTYTGAGQQVVTLAASVTLQGGWDGGATGAVVVDPDAHVTVLDGEDARRVITITGGNPVVRGLTIRRGNATGLIAGCEALIGGEGGCGGGIFAVNSVPTIESNVIEDNVACSALSANSSGVGGGIAILYNQPVIRDNVVRRNVASTGGFGRGGGIAVTYTGLGALVEGNEISANTASTGGSGIGGGVYSVYGRTAITGNLIEGNTATTAGGMAHGSALYSEQGEETADGNVIVGNRGESAVFIMSATSGRFATNRVTGNVGKTAFELVGCDPANTFVVANNFIADGQDFNVSILAGADAGMIVRLVHNTIIGNGYNTAVLLSWGIAVTLDHNILAHHWLAVDDRGAAVTMNRTLFWRNATDGVRGVDPLDGNPNFVDLLGRDYHLRPGSAAIDAATAAGAPATADIDGQSRPAEATLCDIGADELPPTRFDCGTSSSPVAPGYARLSEAERFSTAAGYGWLSGAVSSRNRGSGTALTRDLAFTANGTFALALPIGLYDVTMTLGDAGFPHDQMRISIEGEVVDTLSTAKGQFLTRTWRRSVVDGQLTIALKDLGGTDTSVAVNAIEVRDPAILKLDFGTAVSPVASGFTAVNHGTTFSEARGYGWAAGSVASRDRGTADPLLRDLCLSRNATFRLAPPVDNYSVQLTAGDAAYAHDEMLFSIFGLVRQESTAAGETTRVAWSLLGGFDQFFDVTIADGGGSDPNAVINSLEIEPMPSRRFDLGTTTSPLAGGYRRVTPATTYRPAVGYGWIAGTVSARDRGTSDPVGRDFIVTRQATFAIDVPRGYFRTFVVLGDPTVAHDLVRVTIEGEEEGTISTAAGQFMTVNGRSMFVDDGQIIVVVEDLGGADANATITSIIVY